MARRYLLLLATGAFAAATVTAGFVWFMDPLAIYTSPRIEGVNALKPELRLRSRIFKTVRAASGEYEALVVGTSRADVAIDPQHEFFRGMRCFNAGTAGQSPGENLALVRSAAAGHLRRVLLLLDFEPANAYYEGAPDFVAENYRPWRKATLALDTRMLGLSARMPFLQDREALLLSDSLWLADGRYMYPPPSHGNRVAALVSETGYLSRDFFRGTERRFALANATRRPVDSTRELVRLSHEKGMELQMAISPVHARQLEAIAAAGLWREWEDWKRALVAINEEEARRAGREPYPLWDFSGYNAVTTEPFPALNDARLMRWHFESSHFTPATGSLMLDRMGGKSDADFGTVLSSANLDRQIASAREGRKTWRAANPRDVQEIQGLARILIPAHKRPDAT